jgi:hypothetical protein
LDLFGEFVEQVFQSLAIELVDVGGEAVEDFSASEKR